MEWKWNIGVERIGSLLFNNQHNAEMKLKYWYVKNKKTRVEFHLIVRQKRDIKGTPC